MDNEQEWRSLFLNKFDTIEKKLDKIESEMVTLKVKVALFSSAIGGFVSLLVKEMF